MTPSHHADEADPETAESSADIPGATTTTDPAPVSPQTEHDVEVPEDPED